MNLPFVGSLVNAAVQGLGGWFNYKGQKEANETNISLANQAQQHEIDMYNLVKQNNLAMYERQWSDTQKQWEKQNAYNSPAAQMQRYADAGLNPNLIYSQGQPGQASTVSSPSISVPSTPKSYVAGVKNAMADVQIPNIMTMLNAYQDWKIKKAQTDQIQVQTELLGKKVVTEGFNAELKDALSGEAARKYGMNLLMGTELSDLIKYNTEFAKEKVRKIGLESDQLLYNLNTWNPAKLKQLNLTNEQLGLDVGLNTSLKPYGMTEKDPILVRLFTKLIEMMDVPEIKRSNWGYGSGGSW